MAITESQRRQLQADFERALGAESAATMMDVIGSLSSADVARQSTVDAQFVAVRGEMAELRADLKGEMAELRADLKGEMADLRADLKGEMAELRADVRVLEGTVDRQVRRVAAVNAVSVLAASISTAGLVLAAAHFA
jgi:hypothetical protein